MDQKNNKLSQLDRIAIFSARNREAEERIRVHLLRDRPRLAKVYNRLSEMNNIVNAFWRLSNFENGYKGRDDFSNLISGLESLSYVLSELGVGDAEHYMLKANTVAESTDNIIGELDEIRINLASTMAYVPVGLSACIETFFKSSYIDIINKGGINTRKSAVRLLKRKEISIEALLHVEEKSFSVSELLSMLLWSRSSSDIGETLNSLVDNKINFNFAKEINKELNTNIMTRKEDIIQESIGQVSLFDLFPELLAHERKISINKKMPFTYEEIKNYVDDLFDVRNKICHEAYTEISSTDYTSISDYVYVVTAFLWASEFVIESLIKRL